MSEICIISLNCQGIGQLQKRTDIFQFLKEKKYNIYCLQDTRISPGRDEMFARTKWNDECYFSSYKSNARGVAICFNSKFEYKVHGVKSDPNGNYLILDVTIENNKLTLAAIYGPNNDNPTFFSDIIDKIENIGNEKIIWCGDFNLVLDPDIDYCNYKNINNKKAREKVLEIMEDRYLEDPFRELHPSLKRYTWRRKHPFQQAK